MSETAGGEVLTSDYGPWHWSGTVALRPMKVPAKNRADAHIKYIRRGRLFHAADPVRSGPAHDPDGSILGAATPSVLAIPDSNSLRIQGLPTGYEITPGDLLTVITASTGRVVLFEAVEAGVGGGVGNTDAFAVSPYVPDSVAAGDEVVLVRPYCRAIILPGSFRPGGWDGGAWSGMSFDWIQRL